MRKMYVLLAGLCIALTTMAQADTTSNQAKTPDTIRIGSLIIVKKGDGHYENRDGSVTFNRKRRKNQNISTNWIILDLGFSNYSDKTNYTNAAAAGVIAPGIDKEKFNLRNGKSIDVNIWLFMQRLNLIKHVVNLKYGLGVELNNYRYESPLRYDKANNIFTQDLTRSYKKNKLAADYVTVPVMLNFNFTPNNDYNHSFGVTAGVSAGYLYSSRQKMITREDGKQKTHDDFYLRPFKISYVAELQLGPVKLYGSLATQSMFEKGLDQTPYNLGVRFSNW
ncbi:MAG: outer membrane beta-barrel protein [Chitinophagaceae bacterium]